MAPWFVGMPLIWALALNQMKLLPGIEVPLKFEPIDEVARVVHCARTGLGFVKVIAKPKAARQLTALCRIRGSASFSSIGFWGTVGPDCGPSTGFISETRTEILLPANKVPGE